MNTGITQIDFLKFKLYDLSSLNGYSTYDISVKIEQFFFQ